MSLIHAPETDSTRPNDRAPNTSSAKGSRSHDAMDTTSETPMHENDDVISWNLVETRRSTES